MKTKPQYILLIGIVCIYSCKNYKINCSKIKTGIFVQYSKINNKTFVIERNDTLQTEKDLTSGQILINKIKWISPCSYLLTPVETNNLTKDNTTEFFKANPIKIDIVEVKNTYYIFSSRIDSANKSLFIRDTIFFKKDINR